MPKKREGRFTPTEDSATDLHVDERVARWAAARVGVVTRLALIRRFGLKPWQVDYRLACGRLRPTDYEGVYVVGHASPGVRGRKEAIALAACGPGAVLAAESSAWLRRQISSYAGDVAVIVPVGRHGALEGIRRFRRVLLPDDVTTFGAMRVTTPERTVLDLPPEHLREGFQWLMRNGTPIEPLVERKAGLRGAKAFRHEASLLVPQLACTQSELEAQFVLLCQRIGTDLPLINASLVDGDLLDCTWPGRKLVVELDGRTWHQAHFEQDRARDRRRTLEGKLPMRFGWFDVVRDGDRTGSEVVRGLALG